MSLPLSVPITLPNGTTYDQPTGLFINNEFVPSVSGKTFEVISPSTEEPITHVYEADKADVDIAVTAATHAFNKSDWATSDPSKRSIVINRLANLVEQHLDTLVHIESLDNGKTLTHATDDVSCVIAYFRVCAGWADKITGDVIETGDKFLTYTRKEPVGVCGQIIPWNFPLMMAAWKLGPVLATGCTSVLKSAETTPLSVLFLGTLIKEAGIPAGVVNILSGYGNTAGQAIAEHPDIHKIAFTGSTATGRRIMSTAAQTNLKKVSLELGGKSANIVFNDADIPNAIHWLVGGIFYNNGEVCSAASRIYVQEDIYDIVLGAFKQASEGLKVGSPFDKDSFLGAQSSQAQLDKILAYIDIGKKEGATLVTGGARHGSKGFFVQPTIFGDVTEDMKIVTDEIFGPVVTITKFKTIDEAIELANASNYGLAAGVYTENIGTAINVAHRLQAGSVWVNTFHAVHPSVPFGGYGESGFGREMGAEALDSYTQVKAVRVALKK